MDLSAPIEIQAQVSQACAVLRRHLSDTLQAIHLFGSAVDGGLKPHSDIDLLATVGAPLAQAQRQSLMADLLAVSAWPGTHASLRALEVTIVERDAVVPWRYPPMRALQFGEWLRADLRAGIIEPATPDPDLAILLAKARQRSLCLFGPPARELFDPIPPQDFAQALADTTAQWNTPADWQGDERTVVLALARIWYSVSTDRIASKDTAAAWALERLPDAHRPILADARAAYLDGVPDGLADRPAQVAAYVRYAKAAIEATRLGTP